MSTPSVTSSSASSTTSSAKKSSFWPRELMFSADPHPSQLPGGLQLAPAPMCPCQECWEYGSHGFAPRKQKKASKPSSSSSSSLVAGKKSPLQFLKKSNPSVDTVASDLKPLRKAASVYSEKQY